MAKKEMPPIKIIEKPRKEDKINWEEEMKKLNLPALGENLLEQVNAVDLLNKVYFALQFLLRNKKLKPDQSVASALKIIEGKLKVLKSEGLDDPQLKEYLERVEDR